MLNRREFMTRSAAAGLLGSVCLRQLLAAKEDASGLRGGVCDWSLGGRSPAALDVAKRIQLDGVEVSPAQVADKLSYADPAVQEQYKAKMKETGIVVSSLAITIANRCPLATDPRGPSWLEQTIDATQALGAHVILMAFFGKGDLRTPGKGKRKLDDKLAAALAERLKAVAPRAKEKGVILGLENTLSAADNLKIMDAVGHESVQVYYDIANSTRNGYDVPAEIRLLGKNRICQFHFKDNKGAFNSGDPEMGPIIEAVKAIDYKGWLILERSFGKDKEAYFKKNAQFVRKAFGLPTPG